MNKKGFTGLEVLGVILIVTWSFNFLIHTSKGLSGKKQRCFWYEARYPFEVKKSKECHKKIKVVKNGKTHSNTR